MDRNGVSEILSQVQEVMKFPEVVEYEDDTVWTIATERQTEFVLDFHQETSKVIVSSELGMPPDGKELEAFYVFLQYNYQIGQTGGARIGLRTANGPAALMVDLACERLDRDTLIAVISNIEEMIPGWQAVMQSGGESDALPQPGSDEMIPV